MKIHLTVIFKSKPERAANLSAAIINLVHKSKAEAACLQYDLHQNMADETEFILHETWANAEGLQQHNEQKHLKDFAAIAKDLLAEPFKVYKTTQIA